MHSSTVERDRLIAAWQYSIALQQPTSLGKTKSVMKTLNVSHFEIAGFTLLSSLARLQIWQQSPWLQAVWLGYPRQRHIIMTNCIDASQHFP
jgi:hypothetical protein